MLTRRSTGAARVIARPGETPTTSGDALYRVVPRTLWILFSFVWLFFLIYPLTALPSASLSPAQWLVVIAAMLSFVVTYLWLMLHHPFQYALSPSPLSTGAARREQVLLALLTTIILTLTLTNRAGWLWFICYAGIATGVALPTRRAMVMTVGLMILTLAIGWIVAGWPDTGRFILLVAAGGFGMIGLGRLIRTIGELRAAREELAHMAVSEERLRLARDLHDLLGRNLSLIALKSEVTEYLFPSAPDQALAATREVGEVARATLREVRAVVAGYRQPNLSQELRDAREILAAAGIAYQCEGQLDPLPERIDAALAAAVREGITNVIRHSRAAQCLVRVWREPDTICLEVSDDGRGTVLAPDTSLPISGGGHGLAGLRERISGLGGHCEAGECATGGFRLHVVIPYESGGPGITIGDATNVATGGEA